VKAAVKMQGLLLLQASVVLLMRPLQSKPFPIVLVALEMTAQATQKAQKRSYRPILKATGRLRLKTPGAVLASRMVMKAGIGAVAKNVLRRAHKQGKRREVKNLLRSAKKCSSKT
jgi:hypothetical protein